MAVVRLASGVFTIRGSVSGVFGLTISRLGFGVFVLTIPGLGFGVFTIVRLGKLQSFMLPQHPLADGERLVAWLQRVERDDVFLGEGDPELVFAGLSRKTVTLSLATSLGRQRFVLGSVVIDDRL